MKKQEQDAEDKKIGKKVKTIEFASEEDKEAAKEEEKRKRELLREAHNAPGLIAKIEKALEVLDKEITTFDSSSSMLVQTSPKLWKSKRKKTPRWPSKSFITQSGNVWKVSWLKPKR